MGDLPDDFLRVPILPASSQEEQDRAAAIHLQNQIIAQSRQPQVSGRYEVSVTFYVYEYEFMFSLIKFEESKFEFSIFGI